MGIVKRRSSLLVAGILLTQATMIQPNPRTTPTPDSRTISQPITKRYYNQNGQYLGEDIGSHSNPTAATTTNFYDNQGRYQGYSRKQR